MPTLPRLNPTPYFPDYAGPHQVGTAEVEIPVTELQDPHVSSPDSRVTTISFRVYYPCRPGATAERPVRWIPSPQSSVVSAYARFLGAGHGLSKVLALFPQLLYYINIPATRDAPLLAASTSSGKWPVVIFSHGLGGSKNAYSHICGSLASHGIVVFAPEHRDGSCPISYIRSTKDSPRTEIGYQRYPHSPSPEVYNGRDAQLRVRLWELNLLHTALQRLEQGDHLTNLKTDSINLEIFASSLNVLEPGAITFAGHSFGAATSVQLVKSAFYKLDSLMVPSQQLSRQVTSSTPVILLDMWALPLQSPNTRDLWLKPMPCFADSDHTSTVPPITPLLSILSETFFKWADNLLQTKQALSDPHSQHSSNTTATSDHIRPRAHLFYPLHSAHFSQSDFGILFPNLTRYLAKADEPERTLELNVRAILQVLREGGVEVAGASQCKSLATKLAKKPTSIDEKAEMHSNSSDSESERSVDGCERDWDYGILSTQEGTVRGWIAVDVA